MEVNRSLFWSEIPYAWGIRRPNMWRLDERFCFLLLMISRENVLQRVARKMRSSISARSAARHFLIVNNWIAESYEISASLVRRTEQQREARVSTDRRQNYWHKWRPLNVCSRISITAPYRVVFHEILELINLHSLIALGSKKINSIHSACMAWCSSRPDDDDMAWHLQTTAGCAIDLTGHDGWWCKVRNLFKYLSSRVRVPTNDADGAFVANARKYFSRNDVLMSV